MNLSKTAAGIATALALAANANAVDNITVRFGHFPNVTHAQGVIAHAMTRQGKGWFESRLGPGVDIQWFTYNAGPSAMEAMFAGSLDLTYVGQGPALNAYLKADGTEIRIISGAATGGAALVVRPDDQIKTPADFRGKVIATPQLGNTQDISCRAWLKANGFNITQTGGDVKVLPVANPDQLGMFQQKQVSAVWTVEPWVTRLLRDGGGKVFLEDTEVLTTWLASTVKFLADHHDLAQKVAKANAELTDWIKAHPEDAQKLLVQELEAETKSKIEPESIAQAWQRIKFTTEVSPRLVTKAVADGQAAGFIKGSTDTSKLIAKP
jgi:NitT/TauT family transport system substrate-binding protein